MSHEIASIRRDGRLRSVARNMTWRTSGQIDLENG